MAAPRRIPLTSAAGAEKNAGEDDEPEPVVIEKLTNAVAVHKIILPFEIEGGEHRTARCVCRRCRSRSAVALLLSFYAGHGNPCADFVEHVKMNL